VAITAVAADWLISKHDNTGDSGGLLCSSASFVFTAAKSEINSTAVPHAMQTVPRQREHRPHSRRSMSLLDATGCSAHQFEAIDVIAFLSSCSNEDAHQKESMGFN
jgi:hypothetical protein